MRNLPEFTHCRDTLGNIIGHMQRFRLDSVGCQICTCIDGLATDCILPDCSHPHGCSKFSDSCCELECGSSPPVVSHSTDLGLRLIASTLTAVLSLALLLFLIYRLRQRRHRGAMAHCTRGETAGFNNNNSMSLMEYLHCSGYLPSSNHVLSYHPPPPPYTVWKPVCEPPLQPLPQSPPVAPNSATSQCGCSDPPPPYSQALASPPLHYDLGAGSRTPCWVVAPSVRALAEVLSVEPRASGVRSLSRTGFEPRSVDTARINRGNINRTTIGSHEESARTFSPADNVVGSLTFTDRSMTRRLTLPISSESSV